MKLYADNLWTYIDGFYPRNLLDKVTSYAKDGAWFSKAYRKGYWDGRVRYTEFDRSKQQYKFPTGFLDRVTQILDENHVDYRLYDSRTFESVEPVFTLHPNIDTRDGKWSYQADVLEKALSKGRGILKMATGAGKTEVGAAILNSINRKSVWLTHRTNLMYQTTKRLMERLQKPIGMWGGGNYNIQQITVAMVQSSNLSAEPGYEMLSKCLEDAEVVIGDEIHHLESDQWYEQFCKIPAAWRYGLTATPNFSGDGMGLLAMTGDVIAEVMVPELIERGVLVFPRIWFLSPDCPKIDSKVKYQTAYRDGIVYSAERNEAIVQVARMFKIEGKPTITLVKRVGHGELLADLLSNKGVKTEFIQGKVPEDDRQRMMRRLSEGRLDHVVAMAEIMGEGADFPFLRAAINATATRGGGGYEDAETGRQITQFLGRILRQSPGKQYADYVDIADTHYPGFTEAAADRVASLDAQGYSPFIKYWREYTPDL